MSRKRQRLASAHMRKPDATTIQQLADSSPPASPPALFQYPYGTGVNAFINVPRTPSPMRGSSPEFDINDFQGDDFDDDQVAGAVTAVLDDLQDLISKTFALELAPESTNDPPVPSGDRDNIPPSTTRPEAAVQVVCHIHLNRITLP